MPLEQVAPILCAGITVYKGLKESGAKPGQTVAIVGAGGGLGSLAQQYAKAMGLQVVAIDTGAEKRDMCLNKLGASAFVDFKESKDVVADVRAAANNGEGPQYVFLEYSPRLCPKTELLTRKTYSAVILVAVSEKPFHQAAEYVRKRGTVVAIGLPADAYLKAPVFESVLKMVNIKILLRLSTFSDEAL
jgi:propanol-preferring alcohol dehydrogenase